MKNPHTLINKADLYALYQALIRDMQQPPPADARPLVFNGFAVGWATPPAVEALRDLPIVSITDSALQLQLSPASPAEINQGLASVAEALRVAGCAGEWRDELLEVWAAQRCGVGRAWCRAGGRG